MVLVRVRSTVVFFFQAEDGIRDKLVTGVQTCALPIYLPRAVARRVAVVLGRLDDHLVRPDTAHHVVQAFAVLVERPLDPQSGEAVRHDTHAPRPGAVAGAVAERQHLRRRHSLAPRAEGTVVAGVGRRCVVAERVGALAPLAGDDDPAPGHPVLAELGGHGDSRLTSASGTQDATPAPEAGRPEAATPSIAQRPFPDRSFPGGPPSAAASRSGRPPGAPRARV